MKNLKKIKLQKESRKKAKEKRLHYSNPPDENGICWCTQCGKDVTPFNDESEKKCE